MSAGLAASGMRGEANGGEGRRPRGEDPDHEDEEGAPPQRQQQQPQRPAARPPSGPQQPPPPAMTRNVGYVGKHRLSAAIARLDQELQSLQVCAILLAEPTNQPPRPSSSSPRLESQQAPTCCRRSFRKRVIQILPGASKQATRFFASNL